MRLLGVRDLFLREYKAEYWSSFNTMFDFFLNFYTFQYFASNIFNCTNYLFMFIPTYFVLILILFYIFYF